MEKNEAFNLVHVLLLGADAVVLAPDVTPDPVEQLGPLCLDAERIGSLSVVRQHDG